MERETHAFPTLSRYLPQIVNRMKGIQMKITELVKNKKARFAHFREGNFIYETKDGKHVTLAALEPKFWHTFCTHVGHLELLPFHAPVGPGEREQAIEILRSIFKTKTRDEWLAELGDIDACVGPIYSIDEALNDPQAQARGVRVSSGIGDEQVHTLASFPRISGVEDEQRYAPPALGEHTDALLREVGYSEDEIAQLREEGAIG